MLNRRSMLLWTLLLATGAISAAPPTRTAQRITPIPGEPPLADAHLPGTESVEGVPFEQGINPDVELPTPSVSIRVRVKAAASVDQDLEYTICVKNQSQAAAHHVTVRNPLPSNATFVRATPEPSARTPEVVWRLGTLQPGQCRQLTLWVRPSGGDVSSCARVAFEHGQCVTTRVGGPAPPVQPGLTIRKTAQRNQVLLYDAVLFRIEVTNSGSAPLDDVVVTDVLPRELRYETATPAPATAPEQRSLLRWNLGTVPPGEKRVIDYRALALQEGIFSNRAVVTAAGGLRQEASSSITVGKEKLSLALVGPEKNYANLPANYELTVSNPGTTSVTNVAVAATLPPGIRFIAASDAGQFMEGEVRWRPGNLVPGGKKTFKLELGAAMAGEFVIKGTAKGERDLTAFAEMKTLFQGVAGLTASLTDTDPIEVGQEAPYILTIRNTGTEAVNDLKVTATVPAQMRATDAQGPSKAALQGDKVSFESIVLKPGEEKRYLIYVKALKVGDVRFRVEISAKELTAGPLLKEESTTIFQETPSP
jgi:uncharacterized repeat protein (TIGR01451 family)